MVRIIPWNLPPVNGGSVGGYTPAPTPVTPSNDPYDLDNIVVSADFVSIQKRVGSSYRTIIAGKVAISGVVINDSTSVASVIAHVHVAPGTNTWTGANQGEYQLDEADIDVELGAIMTLAGGEADVTNSINSDVPYLSSFWAGSNSNYPILASTTSTITVTGITIYNSNGVALQEWTP